MLFLKQPHILQFLCHESEITSRIDSSKVSNSKLKLDLCNCVKFEAIECKTPPQQPHKRGTIDVFSYSDKESQSNDTWLHFVEFSNVHNCD